MYEPKFMGDGLRYEISEFISRVNGYNKNECKLTMDESVAMAQITEQFMKRRKESGWK